MSYINSGDAFPANGKDAWDRMTQQERLQCLQEIGIHRTIRESQVVAELVVAASHAQFLKRRRKPALKFR